MALATKCPHCNTIFRVAADQLKLRGGIVRCGSCHLVFDGNAALVEPAAKPTPVIPDVAAELAAPPAPVPAISNYVRGGPVDFELDLAPEPAPAEPPAPAPAPVVEPPAAKPAEAPQPAVWRSAAPAAPIAPPAPPAAEPSPDDAALAAVARAFATANKTGGAPSRPPASLSALVSPDDAFSAAAADESPAPLPAADTAPPLPAPMSIAGATPSAAIDEKLLVWEDIPANESAASDAAAMAAVSRAFSAVTTHAPQEKAAAQEAAPIAEAPAPVVQEPEPLPEEPAPAPAAQPPLPAKEAPAAEAPAAPEPVFEEPAPPPAEELPQPVEELPPPAGEAPQPVEEAPLPAEEAPLPAEKAPLPAEETPLPADEAPQPAGEPLAVEEEPVASAAPGSALVDAVEQWSADHLRPDGRIEPSLDTPQEHIVLAALDDTHHFEDLPPDEPLAEAPSSAEVEEAEASDVEAEVSLRDDSELSPTGEPWSMSEPDADHTALHAIAAVNTDAPDDGESVFDEEPAPDTSAAAARMRAIAGVDETEGLDHSDLSFVKRVERSQKYGKAMTISMAIGIPLLLAGLALQAGTTFRDTLAANYPQLKPVLAAMCEPLGCKIALPAQIEALSVEQGELAAMAENTFSYSTVLRNHSKTVQAWPHVELTLNDNADKPVLRRVFAPREYLQSPAEAEKGFAPHSEESIKLYFELKELKASGYHIAIFYP